MEEIVLTGIKPTGIFHFGNYIGSVKPVIQLSHKYKTFVFIADLHALNSVKDKNKIKEYTYNLTAAFLSLGLSKDAVLFKQSDIYAIPYLTNLLLNITPKSLMNRAHAYKDIVNKNINSGLDEDTGINMGLYTYPVLMTADILAYNSDFVPVGIDQKQHIEFARDIAVYFNNTYGNTFKLPKEIIQTNEALPGLNGEKMSKSHGNILPVFSDTNTLKKNIMQIITDSKSVEDKKDPNSSIIFSLYKHFAENHEIQDFKKMFTDGGYGYGKLKTILFEKIESFISPARQKYNELINDKKYLDEILIKGSIEANKVANKTLADVKNKMIG